MPKIITGYTGTAHITAEDDRIFNAIIGGDGNYIFNYGNNLSCIQDTTNTNNFTINTGAFMINGTRGRIESAESINCSLGNSGFNRNDLICIKYTNNQTTGLESFSLAIVQGEETTGTATDPTATDDTTILEGTGEYYYPIYRIPITGSTIGTPVALFYIKNNQNVRTIVNTNTSYPSGDADSSGRKWAWRKFSDGTGECWMTEPSAFTVSSSSAEGNLWFSNNINVTLPITFGDVNYFADVQIISSGAPVGILKQNTSTANTLIIKFIRSNNTTTSPLAQLKLKGIISST